MVGYFRDGHLSNVMMTRMLVEAMEIIGDWLNSLDEPEHEHTEHEMANVVMVDYDSVPDFDSELRLVNPSHRASLEDTDQTC